MGLAWVYCSTLREYILQYTHAHYITIVIGNNKSAIALVIF